MSNQKMRFSYVTPVEPSGFKTAMRRFLDQTSPRSARSAASSNPSARVLATKAGITNLK